MSKAKILWVDDQIDLLKSHIIFLEEKGYQIDTCTNGGDALDKIDSNRYDIILLDENMPGISGIETLVKIKKINRNLNVIMITKSEEENIMEQAIGKEISDYLIKPVNPNQILLSLKKILQNKKLIKDSNISEYQQEFRNLSLKMMNINSFEEWIKFYLEIVDWGEVPEFDMIINATSLGLSSKDDLNLDFSKGGNSKFFYDIIYNPRQTNFLEKAKMMGHKIENGRKMFIYQAAAAFNIWHGINPIINDETVKLLD